MATQALQVNLLNDLKVEAGELDAQINNASVNVRKVFDK